MFFPVLQLFYSLQIGTIIFIPLTLQSYNLIDRNGACVCVQYLVTWHLCIAVRFSVINCLM